jgi:glucose-1-phosphate thymidylyltransferase
VSFSRAEPAAGFTPYQITNKHLLPIYDKPMIYLPHRNACRCGHRDILVVPGQKRGDF